MRRPTLKTASVLLALLIILTADVTTAASRRRRGIRNYSYVVYYDVFDARHSGAWLKIFFSDRQLQLQVSDRGDMGV